MLNCSRLALAAVLVVTMGAALAAAQTVMVRNAANGAKVEVLLNGTVVGTGAANADGEATVSLTSGDAIGPTGIDANVAVDKCGADYRVLITERMKLAPAPGVGCDRNDISGLFWVRTINTIVINLSGTAPSLLLIRGKYVYKPPSAEGQPRVWRPLATGLVLFGGAGRATFDNAFTAACGDATPCSGRNSGLGAYTFGVTYWFTRFLGAEGAYIKPRNVTAKGGDTFSFDSTMDTDVYAIVAKGGVPAGPVRLYGQAGEDYHQATTKASETIGAATQTFSVKTKGWSWTAGGGGEVWVSAKVALYGEFNVVRLKGPAEGGGEARTDDHVRVLVAGLKVRLAPK